MLKSRRASEDTLRAILNGNSHPAHVVRCVAGAARRAGDQHHKLTRAGFDQWLDAEIEKREAIANLASAQLKADQTRGAA